MYYERSQRRRSSPRRVLILLILVGIGIFVLINQNGLRQRINPPPTPTATRTARSYVVEAESLAQTGNRRRPPALKSKHAQPPRFAAAWRP